MYGGRPVPGVRRQHPDDRYHGGMRFRVLTTAEMETTEKKQLTLTCSVDSFRNGWTVVEFLAHRFKYHTAEGWDQRVRDKRKKREALAERALNAMSGFAARLSGVAA